MATLIFDFDHTLFEAGKLRVILYEIFEKNGVPKEIIKETDIEHRKKYGNFGPIEFKNEIEKKGYKIDKSDMEKFLSMELGLYLKGPVHDELSNLLKKGHQLILLTKGLPYFQKFKIKRSGIEAYFGEHIYICEKNKPEVIKSINIANEVYFINDHPEEIVEVMEKFPNIQCVLVRGEKNTGKEIKNIPIIEDISSLSSLIK